MKTGARDVRFAAVGEDVLVERRKSSRCRSGHCFKEEGTEVLAGSSKEDGLSDFNAV